MNLEQLLTKIPIKQKHLDDTLYPNEYSFQSFINLLKLDFELKLLKKDYFSKLNISKIDVLGHTKRLSTIDTNIKISFVEEIFIEVSDKSSICLKSIEFKVSRFFYKKEKSFDKSTSDYTFSSEFIFQNENKKFHFFAEDVTSTENIHMKTNLISIKHIDECFLPNSNYRSTFVDIFPKEENFISGIFYANLTNSSFQIDCFSYDCQPIFFKFQKIYFTLSSGMFKSFQNTFDCCHCVFGAKDTNITITETENEIKSYGSLYLQDENLFNETFLNELNQVFKLPNYYKNLTTKIRFKECHTKYLETKTCDIDQISIQIRKGFEMIILRKFESTIYQFEITDFKGYKYLTAEFKNEKFDFGSFEIVLDLLLNYLDFPKIPSFRGLDFNINEFIDKKSILRLEQGILIIQTRLYKQNVHLVIPLHPREIPQLTISRVYNSVLDQSIYKKFPVQYQFKNVGQTNIQFKFI
eukprot:gene3873-7087_t